MINSLPIYSNVAETQKKRREEFYKEVGPIYSKLKKMPKEKYFEIKQDFDSGDKSALDRLMDESIYFIVEDVVEIFAKYEIENVLKVEDVISSCIERYSAYIHTFYELPEVYSKYTNSIIQQYVYFTVVREYRDEYKRLENLDVMNPSQLTVAIDKERQYEIENVNQNKQEFVKTLKPLTKKLTEQQKNALIMYFSENNPKNIEEIAKELNITRGRAGQLLRRSLENIRTNKNIAKLEVFRDARFSDDETNLDLTY
jgi:RNA polymerase sigma factor (sigma-70 family)